MDTRFSNVSLAPRNTQSQREMLRAAAAAAANCQPVGACGEKEGARTGAGGM
jgi:hypothetical protein